MLNVVLAAVMAGNFLLGLPEAVHEVRIELAKAETHIEEQDQGGVKPSPLALFQELVQLVIQPPIGTVKAFYKPANPIPPVPVISATTLQQPTNGIGIITPPGYTQTQTAIITPPNPVTAPPPPPVNVITPTNTPVFQSPSSPTATSIPGELPDAPTQLFSLTIPEIDLYHVPIITTDVSDKKRWFEDLESGVGHDLFFPNQGHKVYIFGHSSNYSYINSAYNEVFRYLDKLGSGSIIYVDYNGKRHTYKVYKEEITGPYVPSVLTDYNREELVLTTCWPYLSSANRVIIYADPLF